MNCFTNLDFTFAPVASAALWLVCAVIVAWVARNNRFAGQSSFLLTLLAMLWWLMAVTLDLASPSESCKVFWSLAAWPGITLVPVAWAFFLFDYTTSLHSSRHPLRLLFYIGLPCVVGLIAATNSQTHLLYGTDTRMITGASGQYVYYDHGPLFYTVASVLYIFVMSGLGVLGYAYFKSKKIIRPFLRVLFIITAMPLTANLAYILWNFTVFGFDPTPFMFAVALIALSWLLLNNTMMDTAAQGRSLLFFSTGDPVVIVESNGDLAAANPAALDLFGRDLPRKGETLIHTHQIGPLLLGYMATGKIDSEAPIHIAGRAFEPRILPIESPIQNRQPLLGWALALVDITEREKSAEALRTALQDAEAANRAKSQFLAMISHELRTPMTSVKGGLDLALHGAAGEVQDPLRNLLTIAHRNSLRLLKLVDDVLDLQKLDLGTMKLDFQDLDADTFLKDVTEEYQAYAEDTGARLTYASDPIGRALHVDPHRLKQVVGNVISNAVKFSPKGGEVLITARPMNGHVRISVQDSGVGIPNGMEEQVFGRFNQVESSASQVTGGSGLGMNIAKILIERMGGAITYESQPGEGTTFHIDAPTS